MLVSEIGEFGLIRLLAQELGVEYPPSKGGARRAGLLVDLGDDAVVTESREGALIWTTDTLVEGVHFIPGRSDWESVGWKALAVNVSDVAAMGGEPYLALVTLALPDAFVVEDAVALYRGLRAAGCEFGVTFGGGDIVRAPVFSATVALSGWATVDPATREAIVMTRNAARPGDVVAVSGTPGDSAGGLRLLDAGTPFDNENRRRLRTAHERPVPRVALGKQAVLAGVRCAIDVSDGLVQDLGHIVRMSGAGVRIEASRLPVSEALRAEFPVEAQELALTGGEDYELVLIGAREVIDALVGEGAALTVIGAVVAQDEPRVTVVDETGIELSVGRAGWDHFGGR